MTPGATSAADVVPDRLARSVSAAGQPALGIPIGTLTLGWTLGGPGWGLLAVLALAVFPIGLVVVLRVRGVFATLRITGRPRLILVGIGATWTLAAVAILIRMGAPAPLRAALLGLLVAVTAVILLRPTGVSVHTSVPALFAGVLLPGAP